MDEDRRGGRLRSFVIGGLLGASAVLATGRRPRRRRAQRETPAGLAAFESAPCYRELFDAGDDELDSARGGTGSTPAETRTAPSPAGSAPA